MQLTKTQLTVRGLRRREIHIPDTAGTVCHPRAVGLRSQKLRRTISHIDRTQGGRLPLRLIRRTGVKQYEPDQSPGAQQAIEQAQFDLTVGLLIDAVVDSQGAAVIRSQRRRINPVNESGDDHSHRARDFQAVRHDRRQRISKKNRRRELIGDRELRIAFELCRELGFLHPDHMLDCMSDRQWQDWLILYDIEPLGGNTGADLRMARLAWAAIQGPRHTKQADEMHFLFNWFAHQAAPQTPEEYKQNAMRAWASAGGGFTIANPT